MSEVNKLKARLLEQAVRMRWLSERHYEDGNLEISRRLANVAESLEAEAEEIE
jgi:hypothetical protein